MVMSRNACKKKERVEKRNKNNDFGEGPQGNFCDAKKKQKTQKCIVLITNLIEKSRTLAKSWTKNLY